MPKAYETMRDEFIGHGMPVKAAMTKAAKIYNANRGENDPPVTRGHGRSKVKGRRSKRKVRRRRR